MGRFGSLNALASCTLVLSLAGPATGMWMSHGPTGGSVRAVAFAPSSPTIVYAGTNGGGFFKSLDGGVTWTAINAGISSVSGTSISSLAVDPTAATRVYATSDQGVNQGIFRSVDGGASWSFTPFGPVYGVAIDPATPSTIYVSGTSVHKSIDSGANWVEVLAGGSYFAVSIDPSAPSTVYAGTNSAIYKSTNGGSSWTPMGAGLEGGEPVLALAVHPTIPSIVYAGQMDGGVRKSVDGGANWSALGPIVGVPPFDELAVESVAINPGDPATVYAGGHTVFGGFSVYKTTDAGANWSSTPLTSLLSDLALDASSPAILVAATVHGIARTADGATSWTFENAGLTNTAVDSVVVDAAPGIVYSGTLTDRIVVSTDGGVSWADVTPLPAATGLRSLATDPIASGTLYAGTVLDGSYKSIDGGATWTPLTGGTPLANVEALLVDPTATNVVYAAGFGGVHRSTNGGSSWTPINTGLFPVVISVAIDPSAPNTLYAGTDGLMGPFQGVFKTTNAGASWGPVNTGLTAPVGSRVTALLVDPANPATVYASVDGAGVFKTIDGGASWAPTNTGLSSVRAASIALDPVTGVLYAATLDQGVFISSDAGASWTPFNPGLYNLTVTALALDADNVYAGSGGNGTFVVPLGATNGQPLLGKKIVIKDPNAGNPAKRKLVVVAIEIGSTDTLDPATVVANGATVTITAEGAAPSSQTFALPAPWLPVGSAGAKYLDKAGVNGPVKFARLSKSGSGKFKLALKVDGKLGPGPQPHLTVVPPSPGTGASVVLQVIGGDAYCVAYGGAAGGTFTNTPTVFKVTNPTAQACTP